MNFNFLKNKYILISLIFVILIFLIFFIIFYYKNKITGNTISIKDEEDIIAYVKNIKQYKANLLVTVYSNKNENQYEIYQEVNDKKSIQIVNKPKEIENLTIEKEENNVKIKNTNLNLEKIYTNYTECFSNLLFLDSFSNELNNNVKVYNEADNLILKIEHENNNTYGKYSELTFDKKVNKPTKLEIKDKNQKTTICILYTDIEIN